MSKLTPAFSANRTVREYTENYYLPAALEFTKRMSDGGTRLIAAMNELNHNWQHIRFIETRSELTNTGIVFMAVLQLDQEIYEIISVQLFADGPDGGKPEIYNMALHSLIDNKYTYTISIPAGRPANDYTVRVIPNIVGVNVPMEDSHISWEH